MKLFDDARATADLKKRGELMKRVFDLCADAFETVGVCLAVNSFGIAKTNLQNVPLSYPNAWTWPNPAPALPQQFFFSSERRNWMGGAAIREHLVLPADVPGSWPSCVHRPSLSQGHS